MIKINKNFIEKKWGECFEFWVEYYFFINFLFIFVWKKWYIIIIYLDNCIFIFRGGKEFVIKYLMEVDMVLYLLEVEIKGGWEII